MYIYNILEPRTRALRELRFVANLSQGVFAPRHVVGCYVFWKGWLSWCMLVCYLFVMFLVRQKKQPLRSHDQFTPWQIAVFASFCPRSVSPPARRYTLTWCQALFFSALLQSVCCQPPILGPLFSVSLSLFIVFNCLFISTRCHCLVSF